MPRTGGEKTREQIIRAAAQVFYNVNYHEAGLRDIARLSGISPRAIYKYFDSKEQLLVAMNNEGLKLMLSEMEPQLAGISGTLGRLGKMTYFYLDYFKCHPRIAWQVFISTNLVMWRKSEEAWSNLQILEKIFTGILAEGQRRGEVRPDIDMNAVNLLYFGGIRHAIQSWLAAEQSWDLTAVAEGMTAAMYESVRERPAAEIPAACPLAQNQKRKDQNAGA